MLAKPTADDADCASPEPADDGLVRLNALIRELQFRVFLAEALCDAEQHGVAPRVALALLGRLGLRGSIAPLTGLTVAEQIAHDALERVGYIVLRRGWPDFLAVHELTGRLLPVEVKQGGDPVSTEQQAVHALLAAAGVPVSIFRFEGNVRSEEAAARTSWLVDHLAGSKYIELPLQHD